MSDNELIAEFMGIHVRFWDKVLYYADEDGYIDITGYATPYWPNRSWDQLMLVVDKIEESLLGQVEIHTAYTNINGEFNNKKYNQDSCFESQNDTKLDVTYRAVVKFIKWFQEQ